MLIAANIMLMHQLKFKLHVLRSNGKCSVKINDGDAVNDTENRVTQNDGKQNPGGLESFNQKESYMCEQQISQSNFRIYRIELT